MVKNIAIMDEVYNDLVRSKRQGESFSVEIRRLMERKGSILEFAGVWKTSPEEAAEMKTLIRNMKRSATKHILRKAKII